MEKKTRDLSELIDAAQLLGKTNRKTKPTEQMKHTEVEWKIHKGERIITIYTEDKNKDITDVSENAICGIHHNGMSVELYESNAKLIAQSPKLLKQLQECQDIIKIMLDNNIGRGSLLGKVYLSKVFNNNEKAIEKTK